MMTGMKKIIIYLLIGLFILSGCKATTSESHGTGEQSASKTWPPKLKNAELTIMHRKELETEVVEEYEKTYNVKVNCIFAPPGSKVTQLITMVTAGDSPDSAILLDSELPMVPLRNLVQPIEQYFPADHEFIKREQMEVFKLKGHYYATPYENKPYVVYFNQTMFENNGVKTPLQYYEEGNWNWNTLREAAKNMTLDTDRDGIIDTYGLSLYARESIYLSNNTDLVKYTDDGQVLDNMDDPKVMEAMQFMQDLLYIDKSTVRTIASNFPTGKVAMHLHGTPASREFHDMKYEWGVVPMPIGPHGIKDTLPTGLSGLAIPMGAPNPEGAAVYMGMMYLYKEKEEVKLLALDFKPHQVELIQSLRRKPPIIVKHLGIDGMNKVGNQIWNSIASGTPISTIIGTNKTVVQGLIDDMLR